MRSVYEKLSECSRTALSEYVEKTSSKVASFRFFSYGSNMNEGKFIEDTRKNGHEFRLINTKRRTLRGYKRILGNKSLNHGLAFTVCPSEQDEVEGICHDVPREGLEAFLRKEGVLKKKPTSIPTYEIMIVTVPNEKSPILTLKGLKPFNLDELDCKEKLKAYCYLSLSIQGAKKWGASHSDMLNIRSQIERELCARATR